MKLGTPCCPHCGELATQIEETMLCRYELGGVGVDGEFEYTGEYEDFGDTSQPHIVDGTVQVECPNHHDWRTTVDRGLPPDELAGLALLAVNKMSLRWSYHKKAWVAAMLHFETGNECQFVADSPAAAIEGAHKKATTPKAKK